MKMIRFKLLVMSLLFLVFSACVTVNIYFPAAEVEKAAEQIVNEVYGLDGTEPAPPAGDDSSRLFRWLDKIGPRAAYAADPTTVSNASINALKSRIAAHHSRLVKFYAAGAVGINVQGFLEVINTQGLPLPEVAQLRRLVQADNQARTSLYQEVAKALNIPPQQVSRIQDIFAGHWRGLAQPGWFIQSPSGQWVRK